MLSIENGINDFCFLYADSRLWFERRSCLKCPSAILQCDSLTEGNLHCVVLLCSNAALQPEVISCHSVWRCRTCRRLLVRSIGIPLKIIRRSVSGVGREAWGTLAKLAAFFIPCPESQFFFDSSPPFKIMAASKSHTYVWLARDKLHIANPRHYLVILCVNDLKRHACPHFPSHSHITSENCAKT